MHNLFCIKDKTLFVLLWASVLVTMFCFGMLIWTFYKESWIWVHYYILLVINLYLIDDNIKYQNEMDVNL